MAIFCMEFLTLTWSSLGCCVTHMAIIVPIKYYYIDPMLIKRAWGKGYNEGCEELLTTSH